MALYRYQSDSLIASAQVLTNDTGGLRAYVEAAPGASSEQLRHAKQQMRALGWKCVPIVHEGVPALEVRGFQKVEDFTGEISKLGLVNGAPVAVTADANDGRKTTQKAKSHTLQLAGAAYVVGDFSYLVYAITKYLHKKPTATPQANGFNKLDIAAGVGYALGTAALVTYGGRDQSQNTIDAANKKIHSYFSKEGIAIDDGSTLHATMHEPKRGFFGSLGHTISKFPSETLNAVYVFVGLAMSAAAFFHATQPLEKGLVGNVLKKAHADRNDEWWDVGLGLVTTTSALVGLTIKEKKQADGEPKPQTLVGKATAWVQEKPLRATGYGFMAATLIHAVGTFKKWRSGDELVKKTAFWRGGFVVANVVAETLLAISSKGHGVGVKPDSSIDRTVIASAAELIMRQPHEQREQMILNVAGYMSSRDVLGGKAADIAQQLREHVHALEKNPWTKHYVFVPNGQGMKMAVEAELATAPSSQHQFTGPGNRVTATQHVATGLAANNNELNSAMAM